MVSGLHLPTRAREGLVVPRRRLLLPIMGGAGITETTITSGASTLSVTALTNNITPSANTLALFAVSVSAGGTGDTSTLTISVSGCGLTWVAINHTSWTNLTSGKDSIWVFRALGSSPTTGQVTMSNSLSTSLGYTWSWAEFPGTRTDGTNGSAAIAQSTNNSGSTATSLTANLSSVTPGNATYGAFGATEAKPATLSSGSGYTQIHDLNNNNANDELLTEWRADANATINAAASVASNYGAIGIELAAATSAPVSSRGKVVLRSIPRAIYY